MVTGVSTGNPTLAPQTRVDLYHLRSGSIVPTDISSCLLDQGRVLYFAVQQLHYFNLQGISVDIATVFTIAIAEFYALHFNIAIDVAINAALHRECNSFSIDTYKTTLPTTIEGISTGNPTLAPQWVALYQIYFRFGEHYNPTYDKFHRALDVAYSTTLLDTSRSIVPTAILITFKFTGEYCILLLCNYIILILKAFPSTLLLSSPLPLP